MIICIWSRINHNALAPSSTEFGQQNSCTPRISPVAHVVEDNTGHHQQPRGGIPPVQTGTEHVRIRDCNRCKNWFKPILIMPIPMTIHPKGVPFATFCLCAIPLSELRKSIVGLLTVPAARSLKQLIGITSSHQSMINQLHQSDNSDLWSLCLLHFLLELAIRCVAKGGVSSPPRGSSSLFLRISLCRPFPLPGVL